MLAIYPQTSMRQKFRMNDMTAMTPRDEAIAYGRALASLRKRQGYTQAKAAERAGIEQGTWARHEGAGNMGLMDVATQRKYMKALGLTLEDLRAEAARIVADNDIEDAEVAPPLKRATTVNRDPFMIPFDGTVRASPQGFQVYQDPGEEQWFDIRALIESGTRALTVLGTSVSPLAEPGDTVLYNIRRAPKSDRLAVIHLHDGQMLLKKFRHFTKTTVECVEYEGASLDGAQAYIERPISFKIEDVKAVYPARTATQ